MGSSRMDRVPSVDAPPAASTMKAKGAHSYSSLSFAGADALTGLRKMPPPCAKALFPSAAGHAKVTARLSACSQHGGPHLCEHVMDIRHKPSCVPQRVLLCNERGHMVPVRQVLRGCPQVCRGEDLLTQCAVSQDDVRNASNTTAAT